MTQPDFAAGQIPTAYQLALLVPIVPAVKPADETLNSSTTLQDDDDLNLELAGNATYFMRLDICYNSPVTPGFKSDFSSPAGATCKLCGSGVGGNFTSTTLAAVLTWGGSATEARAQLWGLVTTTNSGVLKLRWAQQTSNASNTTVRAGGVLSVVRMD